MACCPCPDCGSGWRYADELQGSNAARGLVICPTCHGRGNIPEPPPEVAGEPLAQFERPPFAEASPYRPTLSLAE